ncbi:EAL domain-containing protein [Propionivibrio sp.]|uniref:EAL domain-containing protein n=1 Tax=Propionivibrio sp. TaxID=2212460 RepID=UPI003BF32C7F
METVKTAIEFSATRSNLALKESCDRYACVFEAAPAGNVSSEGIHAEATRQNCEAFNLAILDSISAQIAVLDRNGVIVAVNKAWRSFAAENGTNPGKLTGFTHIGVSYLDACRTSAGEARDGIISVLNGILPRFSLDYPCHSPTEQRWFLMNVTPLGNGVVITHTNISQRKQTEEGRAIAAMTFESQQGLMITDANNVIIRVNRAFTTLTGYSAAEAVGKTPALLSSGRNDRAFYVNLWQVLKEKLYWQGEIWNRRKNGQIFAEWLTITAITTPEGCISHYVGAFSDITRNSKAAAEIHRLAYYDQLTQLPNRRILQERLGQALASSKRNGLYGAILFLDMDNFMTLNDTRGHDAGDLLLVEVAQRLCDSVRKNDTVARLGGDEFVVILEAASAGASEAAVKARQVGEKLNEAIAQPFNLNGIEWHATISIGVALFCAQETVEELLKHADLALYQAKSAGRNTVRFFDPAMQLAVELRSGLEAELRQAIKLEQFQLYYQPQIDAELRVIGVEALLRWQHPQRGLVPPNDFIPLAEETGLILPIGLWVTETACAQLKTWEDDARTRDLKIAVNVSARQFRQPDFVAQVQGVLQASGANPALLKLELTESLVLENVEDTIGKMQAIKRLGVKFSLDDFGTGYSSLAYLARLPVDQLKIDQSFVCNLPGNRNDETIAQTIITLGRGLGMKMIAEGVETEEQRYFLEVHGCHAFQGYLYSRPLPLNKLVQYLQQVDARSTDSRFDPCI